jgi:hypothetical protein
VKSRFARYVESLLSSDTGHHLAVAGSPDKQRSGIAFGSPFRHLPRGDLTGSLSGCAIAFSADTAPEEMFEICRLLNNALR